jgi:NADPH:quinone reductase-like Zn-dependent oxidoreductase
VPDDCRAGGACLEQAGRPRMAEQDLPRGEDPAARMFAALALAPLVSQRMVMTNTVGSGEHRTHLATLAKLIEDGKVTPVIGRSYPFADIPDAVRYQEQGHARGKVVITM